MFNNGAQFVGLTPRPVKSKIIFSTRALHLWQTRIYLRSAFSEISIRIRLKLMKKHKNTEARKNVSGSYKKRVHRIWKQNSGIETNWYNLVPSRSFRCKRKAKKRFLLKFHAEIDQGRFLNTMFSYVHTFISVMRICKNFWLYQDLMGSQNDCLFLS